jgi:TPR repeat protein
MAAEQGDAVAQFNIGLCFFNGEGVQQDPAEAVKWFRMADEHGDADALSSFGSLFR